MLSTTQRLKRIYLPIALWIVAFEAIGCLLGMLTKPNSSLWYNNLTQSNLTPPPIVFALVWPMLYLMLALIAWYLWQSKKTDSSGELKWIWYLYILQMLMNWLWTPLFFQFHLIGFSLGWIISLTLLNYYLGYLFSKKNRYLAALFVPYIIWLSFATYLNAVIYWFN